MFKRILIPTDGSERSRFAIEKGMNLARQLGAKVTGLHVVPDYERIGSRIEMVEDARDAFLTATRQRAESALAAIRECARQAGVDCDVHSVTHDHPYRAIIDMATSRHCDLILMASHGRHGLGGLLIGSETHKVLTHSTLPVLVYR